MDNRTREDSIRLLKQLRDAYQSQLDTSVIEEIETAISALEQQKARLNGLTALQWGDLVLDLIGKIVRIVTNISDLMG